MWVPLEVCVAVYVCGPLLRCVLLCMYVGTESPLRCVLLCMYVGTGYPLRCVLLCMYVGTGFPLEVCVTVYVCGYWVPS